MIGWLGGLEPWIKALHIIFMVFWMAALFMLPRFFVYHQECADGSSENMVWIERERRLIRIIMDPSMVLTWICGFMLALNLGAFGMSWFRWKLALVIILSIYHMFLGHYAKQLGHGERRFTGRTMRLLNEIPGVVAIIVIILVVVKPA